MNLSEISDFKKRELEYELRHEKNNYAVTINGRPWKVVADRKRADKMARTLVSKGKDAKVVVTGAPISEGPVIPGNFPNARNDKIAKAMSNDHLELVSEKLNGALVAVKQAVERGMGPIDLLDLQDALVKGIRDIRQFTLPENYLGGKRYVVYVDGVPKIHASTKDEAEEYAMIMDVPGATRKVEIRHEELPKRNEGSKPQKPKSYDRRNPVAKNIEKFNRPATHMDKKKELKKGTIKHKGKEFEEAVDDDFVYASEIVYFDKDGKEIGYLDWDGYTDANTNHSEEELQAIAQKFNISPEEGKVVGYWDGSNDEIDFSGPSDETYPDGTTGVYIDRHSKEESIKEAVDDGQYTIKVNINGRAVEFTGSQGLSKVQANDAVDMLISGKRPGNTPDAARYLPKDVMLFRNGQQIPHNHQDRINEKENNLYSDLMALEAKSKKKKTKKDACYHKVKSRYKVWPSAYASGALVQCRKKGAKNWGNSSKK